MFNNWKSQLRQPFSHKDAIDSEPRGGSRPSEGAEDPQVVRLRKMLADLRGGREPEVSAEVKPSAPTPPETAKVVATSETGDRSPVTDGLLSTTQQLIVEERKVAEALLREVLAREERLASEAEAARAAHDYAAAEEKATAVALLEQEAKEMVRAALELHEASASERKAAEELVARGSAQAEAAKEMVAELKHRLRDAQQSAAEIAAALDEHRSRAKECAAIENVAHTEELEAAELASTCEITRAAAEQEAEAAKERAEALQNHLLDVGDAEILSARIAQDASAIGSSFILQSSTLVAGMAEAPDQDGLAERARRVYPAHPNRQLAFLAGWMACVEQTTTDEAIRG